MYALKETHKRLLCIETNMPRAIPHLTLGYLTSPYSLFDSFIGCIPLDSIFLLCQVLVVINRLKNITYIFNNKVGRRKYNYDLFSLEGFFFFPYHAIS